MTTCTLDAPAAIDHTLPIDLAHLDSFIGPLAAVEASIAIAYEAEAILCGWRPRSAAVVGTGSRALLTTLALRLRGLNVTVGPAKGHPSAGAALGTPAAGPHDRCGPELTLRVSCSPTLTLREATLASMIGAHYSTDAQVHEYEVLVHAAIQRVPSTRGVLARAYPRASEVGREHVEAAARAIVEAEAKYPGWLTRLSQMR